MEKTTKLHDIRTGAGITQKELAERSGVPIKTIQKYETGEKKIEKAALETAIKLSDALQCEPLDLVK